MFFKVLLVTGGTNKDGIQRYDTELYTKGTSAWVNAGPLPSVRWGLAAVSFNNRIFVTGREKHPFFSIFVDHYLFYLQAVLVRERPTSKFLSSSSPRRNGPQLVG